MGALLLKRRHRSALIFIVIVFFLVAFPHLLFQKIHVSHHQQVNPPQALMAETGASNYTNAIDAITGDLLKLSIDAQKMKEMGNENVHGVLQRPDQNSHIHFAHQKMHVVNEETSPKKFQKDQRDTGSSGFESESESDRNSGLKSGSSNRNPNADDLGMNILYAHQDLNNEANLKSMDVEMNMAEHDHSHSQPSSSHQMHIQTIQDDFQFNLNEDKLKPKEEIETKKPGSQGQLHLEIADVQEHIVSNASESDGSVNSNTIKGNSAVNPTRVESSESFLVSSDTMTDNFDDSYLDYTSSQPNIHSRPSQRVKWVKLNWPRMSIVRADGLAANFSARMDDFLNGKSSSNPPCKLHFFMIWISSLSSFGPREHLSLESVFKTNPTACVIILSRSFDTPNGYRMLTPFLDRGFRVAAFTPNFHFLLKSTPAEKWFNKLAKGLVDPGGIPLNQNLSNLLRLAALYQYGGIYIDSDIIVMKSFTNLSNAIGAQNVDRATGQWNRLNNAVMVFDKGNPIVLKFIQEFSQTFDGNKWGHNGPYLVSRVMEKKFLSNRIDKFCRVMDPLAFYPIYWTHMSDLFRAPRDDNEVRWAATKLMQLQQNSYAIHLWNKLSRNMKVEPGSIMDTIFHQFCLFCNVDSDNATSHHVAM